MRSETRSLVGITFAGVLAMGWGFGCSRTVRVEQADLGERVDVDTLLHEQLQKEPMVTVAEAYRAMVILADGEDDHKSFEERRSSLESRGIARPEWKLAREACIDKGSVAYMVCEIIKAPGGANLNLMGRAAHLGDRRYAVRELAFLGLMPQTAPYRYITGGELVDLAAKADRYMAEHGRYGSEPTDIAREIEALDAGPARK